MRVIVAGASGFLGRNTLLQMPRDWDVVALYNSREEFPQFVCEHLSERVKAVRCDLTDLGSIQQVIKEHGNSYDLCLYFAANANPRVSINEPLVDFTKGPLSLMNFLSCVKITRIVFFSSGAVYYGLQGDVNPDTPVSPKLPYAVTKLSSELYLKAQHQYKQNPKEYVIVRFFDAYGPYEAPRRIFTKLVDTFYIQKKSEFEVFGDGKNLVDSMFSKDAAKGVLLMAQSNVKDVTVDFCTGKVRTIDELIQTAAETFNIKNLKIIHSGEPAEYILFKASADRMQKYFNYVPQTPISVGIREFAAFYEKSLLQKR